CPRACGCSPGGPTSGRGRSSTSRAGGRSADGRPRADPAAAARGAGPQRPHPGPARVPLHRRRGHLPVPAGHRAAPHPGGAGPRRQGVRPVPRRGPAARGAHLRAGRAPRRGHAHQLLRGQRRLLRAGHGDPVPLRAHPARRRRPADHAPDPGVPGGGRPHRDAGRGRVGGRRRPGPHAREHPLLPAHRRARRGGRPARRGGDLVIDVAVVATAQMPNVRSETRRNEVEMLMPVLQEVRERAGLDRTEIGFTCSGSTDYLSGQAFSFVSTLDGVGPWPPIQESHVEMDGAWALYEAWVKLQLGEVDTALVYSYGKSSPRPLHEVLSRQLDPYHVAPLWRDAISLAALRARALLESGRATEADLAEVACRSRRAALDNPNAQLRWDRSVEEHLAEEPIVDPLRRSDCPPITDGACAVILAAGDRARSLAARPAWIRGIDHRLHPMVDA